jgi:hypothetical protein
MLSKSGRTGLALALADGYTLLSSADDLAVAAYRLMLILGIAALLLFIFSPNGKDDDE